MTYEHLFNFFGIMVIAAPATLVVALGLPTLLDQPLGERLIARLIFATVTVGVLAAVVVLALMLISGERHVPIHLGNWVALEHDDVHFHFALKFVFDRLSVPFVIMTFLLCGVIGAFTNNYLNHEVGFNRFQALFAIFLFGMIVTSLAGTIETLFAGWELVGLSSALLVAFFHERASPARNGLSVWSVYRVADAAFLIAAVALHHVASEGDFEKLIGAGPWPEGVASLSPGLALFVGAVLLLLAAAGKSALIPFSGWLPRAMEGPTPSSAIFYGALSVHLGVFLLLRVGPILELSPWLSAGVVALGLLTAVNASVSGRVQTDIKSALSFACLTQVGMIVAEIGVAGLLRHYAADLPAAAGAAVAQLGLLLRYFALFHIISHGCLRTLQFLCAPSILRDYHSLEDAIGERLPVASSYMQRRFPERMRSWIYRFGTERGYLDATLTDYVVGPLLWLFRRCDGLERRWTDLLAGGTSRESDAVAPTSPSLDELP